MRSAAATPTIIFVVVVFMSARKRELPPQKLSRSEEHTSELQSQSNLVCRLLLEKKNVVHRHHRVVLALRSLPDERHRLKRSDGWTPQRQRPLDAGPARPALLGAEQPDLAGLPPH